MGKRSHRERPTLDETATLLEEDSTLRPQHLTLASYQIDTPTMEFFICQQPVSGQLSGPYARDFMRSQLAAQRLAWDGKNRVFSMATRRWQTLAEALQADEPPDCTNERCYAVAGEILDLTALRSQWHNGLPPETQVTIFYPNAYCELRAVSEILPEARRIATDRIAWWFRFLAWTTIAVGGVRVVIRFVNCLDRFPSPFWHPDGGFFITAGFLVLGLGLFFAAKLLLILGTAAEVYVKSAGRR